MLKEIRLMETFSHDFLRRSGPISSKAMLLSSLGSGLALLHKWVRERIHLLSSA